MTLAQIPIVLALLAVLVLAGLGIAMGVRRWRIRPKTGVLGGFPSRDAAAVLSICLHRGLTPEQADQVWLLVNRSVPGYPSVAAKQIDDAIAAVRADAT